MTPPLLDLVADLDLYLLHLASTERSRNLYLMPSDQNDQRPLDTLPCSQHLNGSNIASSAQPSV